MMKEGERDVRKERRGNEKDTIKTFLERIEEVTNRLTTSDERWAVYNHGAVSSHVLKSSHASVCSIETGCWRLWWVIDGATQA